MSRQIKGTTSAKSNPSEVIQTLNDRAAADGQALAESLNQVFIASLQAHLYTGMGSWIAESLAEVSESFRSGFALSGSGLGGVLSTGSTGYLESSDGDY